ncbi:MAG: glycosyltransferase family 4 protein [Candidatus Bathyarchaeia archaeon]|jgi:glycosyltransferase involved in cell wall biosynthesis
MNKGTNEAAAMLVRLRELGATPTVITSMSLGLKGRGKLSSYEDMNGVPIYRLYRNFREMYFFPSHHLKEILKIAKDIKPDIIFASQEFNIRLAILTRKYLAKPLVILVEDAGGIYTGEHHTKPKAQLKLKIFGIPTGKEKLWSWMCKNADALITCHPRDKKNMCALSNEKPFFYLPWPSNIPEDFAPSPVRKKSRGVYIGSLFPFKNTREFKWSLPLILEKTNIQEFIVIGAGPHASLIKNLRQKYQKEIVYFPQVTRLEALRIISSSFFAYTPVKRGGWGFIGDCWSMKTPIVMTHNEGYVENNVNALISNNGDELVENINNLSNDEALFSSLQKNGYEEYKKRTPQVIGDQLLNILNSIKENKK